MDPYKYGQQHCIADIGGKSTALRVILLPIMPKSVNDAYLKDRYRWAGKITTQKNLLNRWRSAVSPDLKRGRHPPLTGDIQGFITCLYSDPQETPTQTELVALLDVLEGTVYQSSSQLKSFTVNITNGFTSNFIVGIFRHIPPKATVDDLAEFRMSLIEIKDLLEKLKNAND